MLFLNSLNLINYFISKKNKKFTIFVLSCGLMLHTLKLNRYNYFIKKEQEFTDGFLPR